MGTMSGTISVDRKNKTGTGGCAMQIAGEEIERLRRQIMEQIDLTRTVEDEEVYQLIEAQVRDFARERMLTLGEREAAGRPGGPGHPHPAHVPQPLLAVLLPGGPRRLHRAVGGVRNPLILQNNRAQRKFSAPCFVLSRHQPCARPLISVTVRQNTQVRSKTPSGKSQSVRPL